MGQNHSGQTIRVLMIEDDEDDALLSSSALAEMNHRRFEVQLAKTLAEGMMRLEQGAVDVVLLDLSLPDSRGLDTLLAVRRQEAEVPVVVLTGLSDEATAIEALQHGAQDYLVKGTLSGDAISRGIRHAIERGRLVTSLRSANQLLTVKNKRLVELCETTHGFVDNVSHEFRTPLTVVKEFASLLTDGLCGPLNEQQHRAAQIISDRADDLTCMVNDMLDVSRLRAGILTVWRRPARLADIVHHLRGMLERKAERNHVHLSFEVPDDLPQIFCDAGKLGQVITNLLVNAIKFSGDKGRVKLWVRLDNPNRVILGVSDDGPGIEGDKLRVIFDRFTQLDQDVDSSTKGVGLGLAIVKDFVALNLGEISVASAPGQGSTFSFALPQADYRAVLECYLDGLRKQDANATIATLEARLVQPYEAAVLPVVDEFLQRNLRPDDLAYMTAPGSWQMFARCSPGAEHDRVEQIRIAWTEECRNWIHGSPPQLAVQACGNRGIQALQLLQTSDAVLRTPPRRGELATNPP